MTIPPLTRAAALLTIVLALALATMGAAIWFIAVLATVVLLSTGVELATGVVANVDRQPEC